MNIIHLNDALSEMKNGGPFSLLFVTLDQNRNTGGDKLFFKKCMLSSVNKEIRKEKGFEVLESKTDSKKKSNQYEHATRNITLENGHIKTVHIRLMLYFNDKKVFY